MIKRFLPILSLALFAYALPAHAEGDRHKPDDTISMSLSAEDWVTTKTARVVVGIEAAVSDKNAGSTREDMTKAVNNLAKGDWRLTTFNRNMDQTGLEHWSASYEARVPENELNGMAEDAKKASKAGMQLTLNEVDFTPTLDEMETARAGLRIKLLKQANDQLVTVNSTLAGRNYRIANVSFGGVIPAMPQARRPMMMKAMAMSAPAPANDEEGGEAQAQKLTLSATVTYAALAPLPPEVITPIAAPATK